MREHENKNRAAAQRGSGAGSYLFQAWPAWPGYFTMAVFLPVRSEGKALFHGKSNLYPAKTLAAHRIPAAGAWPHGLPCRGIQPLRRHAAHPGIPLLGALDVATVKYPG